MQLALFGLEEAAITMNDVFGRSSLLNASLLIRLTDVNLKCGS
jgi:hypothetical protein